MKTAPCKKFLPGRIENPAGSWPILPKEWAPEDIWAVGWLWPKYPTLINLSGSWLIYSHHEERPSDADFNALKIPTLFNYIVPTISSHGSLCIPPASAGLQVGGVLLIWQTGWPADRPLAGPNSTGGWSAAIGHSILYLSPTHKWRCFQTLTDSRKSNAMGRGRRILSF